MHVEYRYPHLARRRRQRRLCGLPSTQRHGRRLISEVRRIAGALPRSSKLRALARAQIAFGVHADKQQFRRRKGGCRILGSLHDNCRDEKQRAGSRSNALRAWRNAAALPLQSGVFAATVAGSRKSQALAARHREQEHHVESPPRYAQLVRCRAAGRSVLLKVV